VLNQHVAETKAEILHATRAVPAEEGFHGLTTAKVAAASWVAFTGVHTLGDTYSPREVLYIGVPALSMTLLYVLTRNLAVVMMTHSLVNLVSVGQAHRA